jgi:FixJ family two-component response regulator
MSVPRKLVAVVDDDPRMLKGVERLLLAHGFDAEVFASAEAFLGRNTGSNQFACSSISIWPALSGIELRRRLAASGFAAPTSGG